MPANAIKHRFYPPSGMPSLDNVRPIVFKVQTDILECLSLYERELIINLMQKALHLNRSDGPTSQNIILRKESP